MRTKKTQKMRGSKTHGGGSMKKRRGAGNRGGRGRAGTGYRGDAKKPSVWKVRRSGKDPAKRGFNSRFSTVNTINAGHLSSIANTLARHGRAVRQKDAIVVNLRELGIRKLLGAGSVDLKLKVGVAVATHRAIEKIMAAGGSVDADEIADARESGDTLPADPATPEENPEENVAEETGPPEDPQEAVPEEK